MYTEAKRRLGIEFIQQVDISGPSDPDGKGIYMQGKTNETSVSVLGIDLRGPLFELSTRSKDPHASINATFALFGTEIGPIKLSYDGNQPNDRFYGTINNLKAHASFITKDATDVELVRKNNRLRFVALSVFFEQSGLENELDDVINEDGSKCGDVKVKYKDDDDKLVHSYSDYAYTF